MVFMVCPGEDACECVCLTECVCERVCGGGACVCRERVSEREGGGGGGVCV